MSNKKFSLVFKLTLVYLVFLSAIGYSFSVSWRDSILKQESSAERVVSLVALPANNRAKQLVEGNPVYLEVPRLGIKTPVTIGAFDLNKKTWLISNDKAHFVDISAKPNNIAGNTLIYAHNTNNLFGPTKNLIKGDIAVISTDNNLRFKYFYKDDLIVLPDDLSVFRYQNYPQLTLLTCSGSWNTKRRLMQFEYAGLI